MNIKQLSIFILIAITCFQVAHAQTENTIHGPSDGFAILPYGKEKNIVRDSSLLLSKKYNAAKLFEKDLPKKAKSQFQFLAFFINQSVATNIFPQSSIFNGQLVGRLFGQNSSTTSDSIKSMYTEQRLLPFFIYQPNLFNGRAILRASFEIDWTWGDQAYGLSGNKGSAINADQVNIQTQNIELELIPFKDWYVNIGLQRLFDTPYNPYRTMADKMLSTGYRLGYWGTDAVGISVRYDADYYRFKGGMYKLYENETQLEDDVTLFELTGEKSVSKTWNVGASAYYMNDRGKSNGGVSIYKEGLSSLLAAANGTYVFKIGNDYRADVLWLGTFFSHNTDYWLDRYSVSGFFNYNLGKVERGFNTGLWTKAASIGGFCANLRAGYRYGQTQDDQFNIDLIYSSGDADTLADQKYSGVITSNSWGMPGAIFVNSGSYLVLPHANVVNRFTPLVSDYSNMGYGMSVGILNVSKGIIPNKLIAKVGAVYAMSNVTPYGGSKDLATEFNAMLKYNLGPFMSVEIHGAYAILGDFYKSNDATHGWDINGDNLEVNGVIQNHTAKPVNPWTAFLVLKWLMF